MLHQLFTEKFKLDVSNANLNEMMTGAICLYIQNGKEIIYFTKEGKIREIDNFNE